MLGSIQDRDKLIFCLAGAHTCLIQVGHPIFLLKIYRVKPFFFRFTVLRKFLHNLQCKNTLNHLNITIHNKSNPIRSTTCFRKTRCSRAQVLFSMQHLTNGQQNENSKLTLTSVPESFIFLTIKDEEVYLRKKRRLDTIIN